MAARLNNRFSSLSLPVPSPWGAFVATYTPEGLATLTFPPPRESLPPIPARIPASLRRWHRLTCRAVRQSLRGHLPNELPPLDLSGATAFRVTVWNALRRIPPGQTRTYGRLARSLHRPRASRAVGQACAANPVPLLIPCHRVLAAGGRLGGFSGGLDWKIRLLRIEGSLLHSAP